MAKEKNKGPNYLLNFILGFLAVILLLGFLAGSAYYGFSFFGAAFLYSVPITALLITIWRFVHPGSFEKLVAFIWWLLVWGPAGTSLAIFTFLVCWLLSKIF